MKTGHTVIALMAPNSSITKMAMYIAPSAMDIVASLGSLSGIAWILDCKIETV